jgi:hypothetical protein
MQTFKLYLPFAFLAVGIAGIGACLGLLLAVFS